MILIPTETTERTLMIDWFLDAIDRGRLTVFDADDMLAQLRLAGDVANLERVATALASRGATRHQAKPWQRSHHADPDRADRPHWSPAAAHTATAQAR